MKNSNTEKCLQCNKLINDYSLYALRKYQDNGDINEDHIFCSSECLNQYISANNSKGYKKIEITRCASYYECLEIDNLRRMCERSEEIDQNTKYNFILPSNFCKPGDAGLIKSAVLLHKQAKLSSRNINIQFGITVILTLLIIGLTIYNIWITTNNSISPKLEEINKSLILLNNKVDQATLLFSEKAELLTQSVIKKGIKIIEGK